MKITLASNSPRRKELLSCLGFEFEVRTLQGIDESYPDNLSMEEIPQYISRKKAAAYTLVEDELLITADTIVWIDGKVLGKPTDAEDAMQMLRRLSGRTHQVITGVTLTHLKQGTISIHSFASVSKVTFASLTDAEIDYYVTHYSPLDKAGAYGIQEWIGHIGIISIEGSYYNVMGLPIQKLYSEMKKLQLI